MMEKAAFCGKEGAFSHCLASFLEEIDQYLDDRRIQRDEVLEPDIVGEMEEFMNSKLPKTVRKNLGKLGKG